MSTYTNPTCKTGSTLVKSRCQCKTAKKTAKKDKYQEHWALVKGQYSSNKPSDNQLKVRRRRIDQVYSLYDKIKKLDKSIPNPKKWRYPPEYCYNIQLQNMIKDMQTELKDNLKDKIKN
jgi:hypothetical protein